MSTDKGFIKIYRDVWDHWIWKSDRSFDEFHAWVDLIMMVNHEDRNVLFNGRVVKVERGSTITSIRQLAVRWGWGRNRVSNLLNAMEKDHMIEQSRASRFTLVKVLNYGVYQGRKRKSGATDGATDGAAGGATDGAQTIHYESTIESTMKNNPLIPLSEQADDGLAWWEKDGYQEGIEE